MPASLLDLDVSRTTIVVDFAAGWDEELMRTVHAAGGEIVLVAEDDGPRAEALARRIGACVFTNPVDPVTGEVTHPYDDRRCPCMSCDICKQAPIKDASAAGRTTVLVSARLDDQKAALLADVVFAAGPLAAWCRAFRVPHQRFTTFADVRRALGTSVG